MWVSICVKKSNIMHILHSKIIGVCKKCGKGKKEKGHGSTVEEQEY